MSRRLLGLIVSLAYYGAVVTSLFVACAIFTWWGDGTGFGVLLVLLSIAFTIGDHAPYDDTLCGRIADALHEHMKEEETP